MSKKADHKQLSKPCQHCGGSCVSATRCPRVVEVEFFPTGGIKRVVYRDGEDGNPVTLPTTLPPTLPSIPDTIPFPYEGTGIPGPWRKYPRQFDDFPYRKFWCVVTSQN